MGPRSALKIRKCNNGVEPLEKLEVDTSKKVPTPAKGEPTLDSTTSRLHDSAIDINDIDKFGDGTKLTNVGSSVNSLSI